MARINVPNSAFPQIAVMAELGRSIALLRPAIEGVDPARRSIDRISAEFSAKAKISKADARKIITQLRSLDTVRITLGFTAKEIFDALIESISESDNPDAKKIDLNKLKAAEREIVDVFSAEHPLGLVNKISRLRFDYANILYAANIITDVRPIFDDAALDVKALTVGYTLELEYTDGTERRQIFAALDAKDIAKLKAACERAQTKTLTIKEKFKGLSWPLLIAGEVTDDD